MNDFSFIPPDALDDGNPTAGQLREHLRRHFETRCLPEVLALYERCRVGEPLGAAEREGLETLVREMDRAGAALEHDGDWMRVRRSLSGLADRILTGAVARAGDAGALAVRGE